MKDTQLNKLVNERDLALINEFKDKVKCKKELLKFYNDMVKRTEREISEDILHLNFLEFNYENR